MIDIEQFKKDFPNNRNEDLMIKYKLTKYKVLKYQIKYKLEKSKEHKSRMIAKRNKMVGRDLNLENLREIASKYKTRGEFQFMDNSAYTTARCNGFLDDICSHMISVSYSIPQLILKYILNNLLSDECLYNSRKIIAPYELDLYYDKYKLAFEYDGKGWHQNNENDKKKEFLCNEKNITLITIIENNRRYEEDIKNQIIENLSIINKITNKNIKQDDVLKLEIDFKKLFDNILDFDDIKQIIGKYKFYEDFKKENLKLYNKLVRMNLLNLITLERINGGYDENDVKLIVDKYEYLNDLIENDKKYYTWICKNNKKYLLNELKYKNGIKYKDNKMHYSIKYLENTLNDCVFIKDIKLKYGRIYRMYKNNNHFHLIIEYLKERNYNSYFDYYLNEIDFDKIKALCKKYSKTSEFNKDYGRIYRFLLKKNLIDEYFSHTETLKFRKKT